MDMLWAYIIGLFIGGFTGYIRGRGVGFKKGNLSEK